MAARRERRGVLAVTTSGRSSAILDSRNRQLCKGFDVTAECTTSGVAPTRPPVDRATYGWIQSANFILPALMVIAAAALTYHQPPDRRARTNQ
jgi:hypothetical protein